MSMNFKGKKGSGASGPSPGLRRMKFPSSNVEMRPDSAEKRKSVEEATKKSLSPSNSEDISHPNPTLKDDTSNESAQKDLMISYSHADKEIMSKIRDTLEKNGITVWVDVSGLQAGVDFLSKIGEAIIDCKLFISLLSKNSVKSKYCRDELALAYVSNRAIFPVILDDPEEVKPMMDTGMRLQLAPYEWSLLGREDNTFEEKFNEVVNKLKEELNRQMEAAMPTETSGDASTEKAKERPKLMRQNTRSNLNRRNRRIESDTPRPDIEGLEAEQFWKDYIGAKEEVDWKTFVDQFKKVYEQPLKKLFHAEEVDDFLIVVLHREMEVEDDILNKYNFMAFCNIDGDYIPLWERVDDQARESWSMKEVFEMDSSVRVEAIENLGKFRSAAVIDALRDLLADSDANVRAVAAVSLARTDSDDRVTTKFLMKTLNDKDRLVREAGCLALGHLKVKQSVSKLLHLWRNDVISHVREAANVALNQIGGPEVEKQMKVTKVLADEIRQLTKS